MKNHPKMLHKKVPASVSVLYLDSNSIVYDCVHAMMAKENPPVAKENPPVAKENPPVAKENPPVAKENPPVAKEESVLEWEARLIEAVLVKIRGYVAYCQPRRCYVAFDGVAPLSKMDQQRSRRHKTLFLMEPVTNQPRWNTNAITPGTHFMKTLSRALQGLVMAPPLGVTMVVSSSEEPGEGEHKLFADLRVRSKSETNMDTGDIVVYGLDADLIMLSLLHLRYVGENQRLWIFREAPHFGKEVQKKDEDEGCLHLDVGMLGRCILQEMGAIGDRNQQSLDDYVFLCFFLGNDFLPHFPCLNIRTHGMPALLEMYGTLVKGGRGSRMYLVDAVTGTIDWSLLHKWIALCAKKEPEWFAQEKVARDKMAQSMWRQKDMDALDQAPLLFRGEEMYIDAPTTVGWQTRYYRVLFGFEPDPTLVDKVCQEYKRGLAWVWRYYTHGCDDWRWRYPCTYAPLMADLARRSGVDEEKRQQEHRGPVKSLTQLAYVLPMKNHAKLIPSPTLVKQLGTTYSDLYVDEVKTFDWSFCRYFWEAHPVLPDISAEVVTQWDDLVFSLGSKGERIG